MAVKRLTTLVVAVLINITTSICIDIGWAKTQANSRQTSPNDWPPSFAGYLIDFCVSQGTIKDTLISFYNWSSDTVTIDSIVPNQPWLSVSVNPPYGPPPFKIPPNDSAGVTLTIDATALPCSAYQVNWKVYQTYGIDTIWGNFAVYNSTGAFFTRKTQIVECNGFRLSISNTGNVGNQDPQAGMYLISDTTNFLYDGTSVLAAVLNTSDTIAARDIFFEVQTHPLFNPTTFGDIEVLDTTFTDNLSFAVARKLGRPAKSGDFRIARVWYAVYLPFIDTAGFWPGPWFGYWINDQWWWKIGAQYKWVIWYRKLYKAPPPCWWPRWSNTSIVNNIYAGTVIDWDVPADSEVVNSGAYTDTLQLIWQRGRGAPYDKYYAAIAAIVDTSYYLSPKCSGEVDPFELYGAHVISNAKYFTGDIDNALYSWVSDSGVQHDFSPNKEDISSILTSVRFDTTADTIAYIQGLAVTTKGFDSLKLVIAEMRSSMNLPTKGLIHGDCTFCAGDFNGDRKRDLSDIIYFVNYLFKGGTKPNPICKADVNYSCIVNLSDLIYLVNYVFKGGPRPIFACNCISIENCL